MDPASSITTTETRDHYPAEDNWNPSLLGHQFRRMPVCSRLSLADRKRDSGEKWAFPGWYFDNLAFVVTLWFDQLPFRLQPSDEVGWSRRFPVRLSLRSGMWTEVAGIRQIERRMECGVDSDVLVFLAVVFLRFSMPLLIPRFPLPSIIACLIIDGVDQTIFQNIPISISRSIRDTTKRSISIT